MCGFSLRSGLASSQSGCCLALASLWAAWSCSSGTPNDSSDWRHSRTLTQASDLPLRRAGMAIVAVTEGQALAEAKANEIAALTWEELDAYGERTEQSTAPSGAVFR